MSDDSNSLNDIIRAAQAAGGGHAKKRPPVHLWEPEYCGDIGMRIARDGQWYYAGSPIGRKRLVRLFSTILRHDADGEYYLVTPAEKIRVDVEDAPFVATLMQAQGTGRMQKIAFETNVGDFVLVGAEHPLRFEFAPDGTPSPYVHVRAELEALISRAAFYDLVTAGCDHEGAFGVWSDEIFFPMMASSELPPR